MLNKLKHTFNKNMNDLKHDVGITNDFNHAVTDLRENVRYQWDNFKDATAETMQDAFALKDNVVKAMGDFFGSSNDSAH